MTVGSSALSFNAWRDRARPLLLARVEPTAASQAIFDGDSPLPPSEPTRELTLSAGLMRLIESISCYRTAGRWELMYRLAWRSLYENPRLLEDAADADVRNATLMDAAIRRDVHKMHAFVRFREVADAEGEMRYVAWFEPEHEILRRGARFFVKRFPNMCWTIATPEGAAVWDKSELKFVDSPGTDARRVKDSHEDLWRTYYRNICNVARVNPVVMQREMPQKYWRNLPEAAEIGILLRDGQENFAARAKQSPDGTDTAKAVREALDRIPSPGEGPQSCRRCPLWQHATQAVVGEGPEGARIMLVGEQPGDEEDLRGRPFVGPAGRVLDEAIAAAGLVRGQLFITNAVKHFKWEPRGKRRLHKKPEMREISACQDWLEREIIRVKPSLIVALGATALRSLMGSTMSIEAARHQSLVHASGAPVLSTYHPSAILRAEAERAKDLRDKLTLDLGRARQLTMTQVIT